MKIFINTDSNNTYAVKTRKKLIKISKELHITIVNDIAMSDMIFSIGGDGTFLKSSKLANKPVIGINTGTVGYLTEINPDNLKKTLENILNEKYHIEKRMMLEGEIIKNNGDVIPISNALNEIAISKNTFGVVRFDAIVNGKLINSYTADGILICTPTGSTAYNLSCGGPIVDPTAEIITLTPIAPHTILNRSIILSDDSIVEIKITELRNNTSSYVLSDGNATEVFNGDIVRIRKSDKFTEIVKIEDESFVDIVFKHLSS